MLSKNELTINRNYASKVMIVASSENTFIRQQLFKNLMKLERF